MHVGIVAPCSSGPLADLLPESGGIDLGCGGYLIATLVRALIGRGHHVSLVTLSPELSDRRILEGPQLTYYVYPMRTQRRMRDLFKLERQGLRDGIVSAKPDILHAHWTYEFAMACLETGLPMGVTCHDNAFRVFQHTRNLYRLGRLCLQIQVIRKARFLTAVSPYLANSLEWLAKARIKVIPNPIDVHHSSLNGCERATGPVKIATVLNGFQKLKNPTAAIKAFSLIRRTIPDAEMYMFGYDFEQGGPAFQWAKDNGLSQNIQFRGPLPHYDLLRELNGMSMLLHPAIEEACPMALLEAMALGLPVVAGIKSGGVPWVLDQGRAGFLTDVRKPTKIAETLRTCIEQVDDRERRQKNAYERVLTLFSPEFVAGEYEQLYSKILSLC